MHHCPPLKLPTATSRLAALILKKKKKKKKLLVAAEPKSEQEIMETPS
jgi:hypothetical protein